MGAMALHGPHQGAQKSTRTGFSACSTSESKLLSPISIIPFAITVFPFVYFFLKKFNNCQQYSDTILHCQPFRKNVCYSLQLNNKFLRLLIPSGYKVVPKQDDQNQNQAPFKGGKSEHVDDNAHDEGLLEIPSASSEYMQ
jgi:hypothetical protein